VGRLISAAMIAGVVFFFAAPAHALKFTNPFVEFELPTGFNCALDGPAWTCEMAEGDSQPDAVIVLAAKTKGENDTLDKFQEFLRKPKMVQNAEGKGVVSEAKYVKPTEINGQPWIDSLQVDSEMQGYYTHYLVTIKQDIAVLVTFSIEKSKMPVYQAQFDNMLKSIKVFRKVEAAPVAATPAPTFKQATLPGMQTAINVFPEKLEKVAAPVAKKVKALGDAGDSTKLLLLVAAVVAFLIYKKKKESG
jgi:hypothetical protein